jgi:hypothetical protein
MSGCATTIDLYPILSPSIRGIGGTPVAIDRGIISSGLEQDADCGSAILIVDAVVEDDRVISCEVEGRG